MTAPPDRTIRSIRRLIRVIRAIGVVSFLIVITCAVGSFIAGSYGWAVVDTAAAIAVVVLTSFSLNVRVAGGARWSSADEASIRRFRRQLRRHGGQR